MLGGLPNQLWTNYRTFFWDNSTGLYFGAALFALGFTTFIISGFVSLCKRTCGGKTISNNPRNSIENPLYISGRKETTSREQLVEAEVGIEDGHQIIDTSESEEEPTVIYENEQFFHAAKQTKSTEIKDEEGRNRRYKYTYSQVIKPRKEKADKKKGAEPTSDVGKKSKGRTTADVYSTGTKKTSQAEVLIDDDPQIPSLNIGDTEASETASKRGRGDSRSQVTESTDTDRATGHQSDDVVNEGPDTDEDYIDVTAPKVTSITEELYLSMSYTEHDPDDYINVTNITKPS